MTQYSHCIRIWKNCYFQIMSEQGLISNRSCFLTLKVSHPLGHYRSMQLQDLILAIKLCHHNLHLYQVSSSMLVALPRYYWLGLHLVTLVTDKSIKSWLKIFFTEWHLFCYLKMLNKRLRKTFSFAKKQHIIWPILHLSLGRIYKRIKSLVYMTEKNVFEKAVWIDYKADICPYSCQFTKLGRDSLVTNSYEHNVFIFLRNTSFICTSNILCKHVELQTIINRKRLIITPDNFYFEINDYINW